MNNDDDKQWIYNNLNDEKWLTNNEMKLIKRIIRMKLKIEI